VVLSGKREGRWLLILAHAAGLAPLALLLWDYAQNQLSADPIREITLRTGWAALVMLLLSLACTPVHILFGYKPVMRLRRPLGLYAFLYAALHALTFVGLDYGFRFALIVREVLEKRFVQAGILSFFILLLLALTSTRGWMKRLGKNWRRLHRLVYLAAVAAVVHFVWIAKGDIRRPLRFGTLLGILLLLRLPPIRAAIRNLRTRLAQQ
jgi:sulfoxide reductase heme-binding subunit YedZ